MRAFRKVVKKRKRRVLSRQHRLPGVREFHPPKGRLIQK